ncbi:MAG: Gmad2 immunoglobulin-like domain-containing protein [Acidimicrobiia bacterium]
MRSTSAALAFALVLAACNGNGVTTSSTSAITSTSSSTPSSTLPPVVECPGVGDFEEGGGIADIDGERSASSNIGRITWDSTDLCETFQFDFETSEGAPAISVPDISIAHLESFQVLRIAMDVDDAVVTDQLVETNLVDRLYVVTALDGGIFVDLHLAAPAAARARVESSPARLSVDLRPGFVPFAGTSTIGDRVVLVSPAAGSTVDPVTQLIGYSRTFEANVTVIVTRDGLVATETNTTAADYLERWGEFRVQLGLPPGEVTVFVGEESPQDGSLEGITVDLSVS